MPLMPATATTKTLKWSDFKSKQAPEPGAGTSTDAAYTAVTFKLGTIALNYVKASKPEKYRWTADPTVTVTLGQSSWVASFVAKRPADQKDALLKHEQGHYLLTALFARDYYNELKVLGATDFADIEAGKEALKAINDKYTDTAANKFHEAYDTQVTNPVTDAATQKKWDAAIATAKTANKPIKDCLVAANLITA